MPPKKTSDESSRVCHMTLESAVITRVIRKDITNPLSSETSPEERHNPVILVTLYGNTGPIHALVG